MVYAMGNRMLYVRKSDESFWARAEAQAEAQGMGISHWVSRLIRQHFYAAGAGQDNLDRPAEELLDEAMALIARAKETS